MCPIEPVSTLFLGPSALDFAGLSVVLILYAVTAVRTVFGRSESFAPAA